MPNCALISAELRAGLLRALFKLTRTGCSTNAWTPKWVKLTVGQNGKADLFVWPQPLRTLLPAPNPLAYFSDAKDLEGVLYNRNITALGFGKIARLVCAAHELINAVDPVVAGGNT